MGLNISLPFEQTPTPYITPDLNLEFTTSSCASSGSSNSPSALVVFPGGFRTLDELTILTLIQTGHITQMPVVMYGSQFWDEVVDF
ncbi:MAG: hypothetical protein CME05_06635 [Gemmatimonadaceae bacterium]|nr:hypothetical protein [Gemmatimonadaceae bacterium]